MMKTPRIDPRAPLKGSPEYRRQFWKLIGLQVLAAVVFLMAVFFAFFGQGTLSSIGWVVAVAGLLFGFLIQMQVYGLIAAGRKAAFTGEQSGHRGADR